MTDVLATVERPNRDRERLERLSGYRRSPTKQAIFGDRTQRVILEFDGSVTVGMD